MKKIVSLVLVLMMALVCASAAVAEGVPADQVKVGYIYIGDENEGYTAAHYEGAKEMMQTLGLTDDQVVIKWCVPETEACYDAAVDLAEAGCNIIIANSFGHESYVMQAAAAQFVGTHDFAAVRSVGTDVKSTMRTVYYYDVERRDDLILLRVCANGFLYNMARAMAGTVVYCAEGKICPEEIGRAAERALAGRRTELTLEMHERYYYVIATPVFSENQITGSVVIALDTTEREQREALRREFSANVSHELKTPLTSISGFAELMQAGLVPMEKVQEFSADIYRESRRLLDLVNDIIKLSRLDEGGDKLERQRVELHALAENVLANLESVAEKCHVTLSLTGGAAYVTGVPALLSEMLYNLCDNAVKYNVDGGSVRVDIAQSTAGTVLTVSDTGIGIPYAHQSRVFERFYRVDKSHSKAVGGTGLGLSIVKHAAQYHNARLELKSAVGKGTEIRIHFPHAP